MQSPQPKTMALSSRVGSEWRSALVAALIPFAVTRLILILIGEVTRYLPFNSAFPHPDILARGWIFSPYRFLDIWGRWDTSWYLNIATQGYAVQPAGTQSNIAFFPLYPLLIRGLLWLIPDALETPGIQLLAAVVVSNVLFFGALVLLYRLALHLSGEHTFAERAVWYLCAMPGSFFFSAAYADGTALFFMIAAFLAAEKRHWWLAGILGGLATLARPQAFLIAIPLLWLFLRQRPWQEGKRRADVLSVGLPALALGAFAVAIFPITHNLMAPIQAQSAWGRHAAWPWTTFFSPIGESPVVTPVERLLLIVAFTSAVLMVRRFPTYALLLVVLLFPPLVSGYLSGSLRYVAMAFPLALFLAFWGKNDVVDRSILAICLLLQGIYMAMWAQIFYVV